jgi:predicted PurR-regulated permease PerM
MNSNLLTEKQHAAIATSLEAVVRIGVLLIIVVYCLQLLMPFAIPVLWGAIIAVALYPLFLKVRTWLGGRNGLAATLISVILIALILGPTISLSSSLFDAIEGLARQIETGQLLVPPPPSGVANWPLIGDKVFELWSQASDNLETFAMAFRPQLVSAAGSVVGLIGSAGAAVLFTLVSLAIAGAFLATADSCVKGLKIFANRLGGGNGEQFVENSALVVKSVASGVIGVAVIQAALGAAGMAVVGVPLFGLWTLILLVTAIAQIPALLTMGPVAVYVFATNDGLTAVVFAVYAIFVSISDGFLKPLLLGRGVNVPTLVILLGAIGGMILQGIIGLFIGAVVLSLAWGLLLSWIEGDVDELGPELTNGVDEEAGQAE